MTEAAGAVAAGQEASRAAQTWAMRCGAVAYGPQVRRAAAAVAAAASVAHVVPVGYAAAASQDAETGRQAVLQTLQYLRRSADQRRSDAPGHLSRSASASVGLMVMLPDAALWQCPAQLLAADALALVLELYLQPSVRAMRECLHATRVVSQGAAGGCDPVAADTV